METPVEFTDRLMVGLPLEVPLVLPVGLAMRLTVGLILGSAASRTYFLFVRGKFLTRG